MAGGLPAPIAKPVSLARLHSLDAAERLRAHGFDEDCSVRVAEGLRVCARALGSFGSDRPVAAFFVPGRIEVFGKHTDYAGGRSLVCAVNRGFTMVCAARADRRLTVMDARTGADADLVLDPDIPASPGHWTDYVRTVARRLVRDFDHATGLDLAFTNDLPPAAGLSTSSALTIAIVVGMAVTAHLDDDPRWRAAIPDAEALAAYAAAVENGLPFGALRGGGGVGTLGGSQDHCAILCARAGHLARFTFAPVRLEGVVALPAGSVFAVASSGVRAEKSAAALDRYNRLSRLAGEAAALWRERSGRAEVHLGAVLEAGLADECLDVLRAAGRVDLHTRAAQFFRESGTLVPSAQAALEAEDLEGFGHATARSQEGAERHLGNQVPETTDLVRLALREGAHAASAFGAGFGGSVWALTSRADASAFLDRWCAAYAALHPARKADASFFVTPAGPPTVRIV